MTSMEKDICSLVFNQLRKNKRIDTAFINEIIYIYLSHKHMEGFIKENVDETNLQAYSNYKKGEGAAIAAFDPKNKKIVYSEEGIKELNYYLQRSYSPAFKSDDMFLLLSLYVTQIILHELEHVSQFKQTTEKEDTLESKLLSSTKCSEIIYIDYPFFQRNYQKDLSERLAQIRSFTTITNIIAEEDLHNNFNVFFNNKLINEKLRGFDFNQYIYFSTGPTLDYMDELIKNGYASEDSLYLYKKDKEKALLELYGQYSTSERVDFGLPILKQEYDQLNESKPKQLVRV